MAQVEIRQVSKIFEGHTAVSEVSLTVHDGEFLVLLGPSGCGKSTLLRMLAGLELPSYGDIVIGDKVATRLKPKDRNVAMVFQNYALYPHLTIYENIAFPLRVNRFEKAKIDEKVRWAADLVGIEALLQRKPRQTSGGERQRTALARSLVRDPQLFLLDEPLSNLDAKLRHSSREELRRFQDRVGVTSIYVTHDQVEAMGLGDRIVVMRAGKIRQVGTPEQIYSHPADTFVATFIGSPPMNLVETGAVTVGFRPEIFLPSNSFARDTSNASEFLSAPFAIRRVEYLGGDKLIYGSVSGDLPQTEVIARIPSNVPFTAKEGETVPFAVPQTEVRCFDTASGLAIEDTRVGVRRSLNG
ncbi:ATP-binding cassette domain-containing protein [Aurantimonas sp. DM33-3]|uniref:ABC transporter ATP-binding protein n=1 Tax=Aurantimonas sp. DM33-3 TaxID=2766955 RepID=UPI001651B184|nr:ATP-binding cassette domain-containing protein [Aurantimonas sp. DM33-3]MBC6718831.1 ATP-binding cassette domain-containing protein [Aurantimonas sp. DM33-3]